MCNQREHTTDALQKSLRTLIQIRCFHKLEYCLAVRIQRFWLEWQERMQCKRPIFVVLQQHCLKLYHFSVPITEFVCSFYRILENFFLDVIASNTRIKCGYALGKECWSLVTTAPNQSWCVWFDVWTAAVVWCLCSWYYHILDLCKFNVPVAS